MTPTPEPTPLTHLALLLGLAKQAATWWCTAIAGQDYVSTFIGGRPAAGYWPRPAATGLARFEQLLAQHLVRQMLRDPCPSPRRPGPRSFPSRHLLLQVGYGPCDTLADLAELAGLDPNAFPWKTRMYVNWDARPDFCCVEARQGHGYALERLPLAA